MLTVVIYVPDTQICCNRSLKEQTLTLNYKYLKHLHIK